MKQRERAVSGRGAWFRRGALLALILTAAVLWWMEGRQEHEAVDRPALSPAPTIFTDERLSRETAYDRDVAALEALVGNETVDASTREMAAQQLSMLIAEHQSEIRLEAALLEAGYHSAVVLVNNGSVTVMVAQDQLTEENSEQILSLCLAHTEAGAENIRVMARRQ